jgi:GT2 family glycosyltransferase
MNSLSLPERHHDIRQDPRSEISLRLDANFGEIRALLETPAKTGAASRIHVTVNNCSLEEYVWLNKRLRMRLIDRLTLTEEGRKLFSTISLVMFTYNRIEYTKLSLQTLMDNTYYPFDLVIVDNNSTDGTQSWLEEFRKQHPDRIKNIIYNSKNYGLPGPTNSFWQSTAADLLGKVDNDTLVPEGWLERLIEAHIKIPNLAVIGGYHFRPEDFNECAASKNIYTESGISVLTDTHIGGCCYLMKRSIQKKYGLMEVHPILKTHGWTQYQWRLAKEGHIVGYLYPLIQLEYMDDPRSEKCLIDKKYKDYSCQIWKERGINLQSTKQLVDWIRNDAARISQVKHFHISSGKQNKNIDQSSDVPLVSIIILTHNQLKYTKLCLDSIIRTTGLPVEIIIVDNGSCDGTVSYLKNLKNMPVNISLHLITNENNLGFAAGNNQGIAVARR